MVNGREVRMDKKNIDRRREFHLFLVSGYGNDGTPKGDSSAAGAGTDPSAMGQMDPAWLAYYQSMNYYNMMQSNATTTTTPTNTKSTDSTANNTSGNHSSLISPLLNILSLFSSNESVNWTSRL